MTQVRADALARHLERGLAPLYVIHGDEPLLALEAGDAIRAAARRAGCEEREVFVVEPQFRWDAFLANNANLGLFGTRRLVDLRIPTGRPGAEGGKALEAYAARPNPDNVTLVTLPRLDRAQASSAWFAALAGAGVEVAVHPVAPEELPRWVASRLARQGQTASPDTLAFLAESSEGNLLAARQEIEKLALLLPAGELDHDAVVDAVADVAKYDVGALSEAWLAGDAARALRILGVLRDEGESPVLPVWQLAEDVHALALVQELVARGVPPSAAVRQSRVWGRRAAALDRAAKRVPADVAAALVPTLARLDALSKGLGRQDPWDELAAAALVLAGKPARPLAGLPSA
ncbi:DNA polymerase III subunit delta [Burkholderiales bacterium]|nr:DNA polymerase III subunit delta [Burkholderiales bacterium]